MGDATNYFDLPSKHGYYVSIEEVQSLRQQVQSLTAENGRLQKRVETLEVAHTAVLELMIESTGVCGLHLNGDIAPWSELRTGGRFEEWLLPFDGALLEKTP